MRAISVIAAAAFALSFSATLARAQETEPPAAPSKCYVTTQYGCLGVDPAPFVIDDDPGGEVDDYVRWYRRVKASGIPVVIRGVCESSCTLVIMLPQTQVCVEPTASFGFHLAAVGNSPDLGTTMAIYRRYAPKSVLDWFQGKTLRLAPMLYMDASTIVGLGVFPPCG